MSAAGILNAKMGKVFGWVKTHNKNTKQQQQQQQQQQRSHSQDGLEMRDFRSSSSPSTGRSLEEVLRGHEDVMDLHNVMSTSSGSRNGSATTSGGVVDLLPPFYHDKQQQQQQQQRRVSAARTGSNSPSMTTTTSTSFHGVSSTCPSTPRPSPESVRGSTRISQPVDVCSSSMTSSMTSSLSSSSSTLTTTSFTMDNFVEELRMAKMMQKKKGPSSVASSVPSSVSSSHIYEEILYGFENGFENSFLKGDEINHLQQLHMLQQQQQLQQHHHLRRRQQQQQHQLQQQSTSPRYQDFLLSASQSHLHNNGFSSPSQNKDFFQYLNRKKIEKKVAFDLNDDEKESASDEKAAFAAEAAAAAAAVASATKRLDETQRSTSYGQLPKELLSLSTNARLQQQQQQQQHAGRRDPALLLDIRTLEALRELQLKVDDKSCETISGRYVRAKSSSPAAGGALSVASSVVTSSSSPKTSSKKENRLSASVHNQRSSTLTPSSTSRHSQHLTTSSIVSTPLVTPSTTSSSSAAAAAASLHLLPGYEIPFHAQQPASINSGVFPSASSASFPASCPLLDGSRGVLSSIPLGVNPFHELSVHSTTHSIPSTHPHPDEPNYRSELAKIERNLLHKNAVSSIIELETALERIKSEVRHQGQLLGPAGSPTGRRGSDFGVVSGASTSSSARLCRKNPGKKSSSSREKKRSASCEGFLADVVEEEVNDDVDVVDAFVGMPNAESSTNSSTLSSSSSSRASGFVTPKSGAKNKRSSSKNLDKLSCRATVSRQTDKSVVVKSEAASVVASPAVASAASADAPAHLVLKPDFPSKNAEFNFHLQRSYGGSQSRDVYRNRFLNELIFINNNKL